MPLTQWMLRITSYAERLLDELEEVDWPRPIKDMQRNWVGRSVGAEVDFPVQAGDHLTLDSGLHDPARYVVWRDLHGAGARAPLGRRLTDGAIGRRAGISKEPRARAILTGPTEPDQDRDFHRG